MRYKPNKTKPKRIQDGIHVIIKLVNCTAKSFFTKEKTKIGNQI